VSWAAHTVRSLDNFVRLVDWTSGSFTVAVTNIVFTSGVGHVVECEQSAGGSPQIPGGSRHGMHRR
jgi:hypothetical protein